jgi:AcrR family transcriptional regulator
MSIMLDLDVTDRRAAILDAAFKTFLAYGFRRTTMGDIADAAGISRPALYIEFKNKADIYREGFIAFLDQTFRNVDSALHREGPIVERINAALEAALVIPMRAIAQAPHGAELFELKQELADDLGENWNAALERCLHQAFEQAAAKGELDLAGRNVSTQDIARLIVLSAEGIKKRMGDWGRIEADLGKMVDLMVRPLVRQNA